MLATWNNLHFELKNFVSEREPLSLPFLVVSHGQTVYKMPQDFNKTFPVRTLVTGNNLHAKTEWSEKEICSPWRRYRVQFSKMLDNDCWWCIVIDTNINININTLIKNDSIVDLKTSVLMVQICHHSPWFIPEKGKITSLFSKKY